MDLVTSLMCAIPGGMSDIPIISEEMGADSGKVAVMQFVRMVFGIGVFPSMIAKVSSSKHFRDEKVERESYSEEVRVDEPSRLAARRNAINWLYRVKDKEGKDLNLVNKLFIQNGRNKSVSYSLNAVQSRLMSQQC